MALEEKEAQYNNCLLDVATCDLDTRDLSTCLCSSFEMLADFCEKNEEGVGDWRAKMPDPLCKPKCNWGAGEVYRLDADPCTQTCDAIKFVKENRFVCISMKMAGCNCEEGKARNADGECIDKHLCPI